MSSTSPPKSVSGMTLFLIQTPLLPVSVIRPQMIAKPGSVKQWNKLDFPAHLQKVNSYNQNWF